MPKCHTSRDTSKSKTGTSKSVLFVSNKDLLKINKRKKRKVRFKQQLCQRMSWEEIKAHQKKTALERKFNNLKVTKPKGILKKSTYKSN